MDLVCIPTFARPEYLQLCLEHLAEADGGREKRVMVAIDRHHKDTNDQKNRNAESIHVVDKFRNEFASVKLTVREQHGYIGNPYNFLELYKAAFHSDARFVYLVEDDVLVGKDFFTWHERVNEKREYFCTVGWHCIRNPRATRDGNAEDYIETAEDFSSIGVCWKREKLAPLVQHALPDYYRDLAGYLRKHFPKEEVKHGVWTEQAGLVMRLLLATPNATVAWPVRARCAHVGINGYHRARGHAFSGTLEQRVEALRVAVRNTEKLVGLSKDPFDDVSALPPYQPWSELRVVQRFEEKTCRQGS